MRSVTNHVRYLIVLAFAAAFSYFHYLKTEKLKNMNSNQQIESQEKLDDVNGLQQTQTKE